MHSGVGREIVGEALGLDLDLPLAHEAIAPVGEGNADTSAELLPDRLCRSTSVTDRNLFAIQLADPGNGFSWRLIDRRQLADCDVEVSGIRQRFRAEHRCSVGSAQVELDRTLDAPVRACRESTRWFDLGFVGVEEPGDVFPCAETGC
ncbi:hypothetical protein ACWDBD_48910, partial [Streptomyces sp. NPDC001118]